PKNLGCHLQVGKSYPKKSGCHLPLEKPYPKNQDAICKNANLIQYRHPVDLFFTAIERKGNRYF
ncbi:MAG: hypothetical protein ACTHLB_12475, partial [Parafilimonas sp.]